MTVTSFRVRVKPLVDYSVARILKEKVRPERARQHDHLDSGVQAISGAPSRNPCKVFCCSSAVVYSHF